MTLVAQHRIAQGGETAKPAEPADGASLLSFAAMRRT
jgi:hypothetical protein